MDYPEYIEVNNKKYKINTDFKIAIQCNEIAQDDKIGDFERAMAIIYLLFGEEALNDLKNLNDILKLAQKFLSCGKEVKKNNEKSDMDFIEDYNYIWASIYSDYNGLDIDKEQIHWWKFMDLMNGLSNSEFGNCCVLNRVRNLRNMDLNDIKDKKEREKIIKAKKDVELKKYKKENNLTEQQKISMKKLDEILKKRRE